MKEIKRKNPILPIFLTIFIDLLGVGIIIPILAPLILKNETGIFGLDVIYSTRTIIFGLLLGSYPIAQFITNPIVGALSDIYGRRKILIYSVAFTALGYFILAFGVFSNSLLLIFIGRIIPGLASGNITIAFSAIADVSDEKSKAKNFGLIGMAFGLGFIIGPFIGGELANHNLISWFTFDTPFLASGFLALINLVVVYYNFPETLELKRKIKISLLTGVRNINKAFSFPTLRNMFIIVFINAFGFTFFTQFFIVLLMGKFGYKQEDIGIFFGYLGIWVVIMQGGVLRYLSKYMKPEKMVLISLPVLAIALIAMVIPNNVFYLFLIIPFMSFGQGLSFSASNAIISNLGGANIQGEILGISQSMNALAQALPALVGGFLVAQNFYIPSFVAGGCALIGWLLFILLYREKKIHKFVVED